MVMTAPIFATPHGFKSIYKWDNIVEGSPNEGTRNIWLWLYDGFACYEDPTTGLVQWFPYIVAYRNLNWEPTIINPIQTVGPSPDGKGDEQSLYNILPNQLSVEQLKYNYYSLPFGGSTRSYIAQYLDRLDKTDKLIDEALDRSLDVALFTAPIRFGDKVKRALNGFSNRGSMIGRSAGKDVSPWSNTHRPGALDKSQFYVIEGKKDELEQIKAINVPTTLDAIGKLWESYDWANQAIYIALGIAYNPEKRERMIQDEMMAQNQTIKMNREFLSSTLRRCCEKNDNGEEVIHCADWVMYSAETSVMDMTAAQIDFKETQGIQHLVREVQNDGLGEGL